MPLSRLIAPTGRWICFSSGIFLPKSATSCVSSGFGSYDLTLSSLCFLLFPIKFDLPRRCQRLDRPWFRVLHANDLP